MDACNSSNIYSIVLDDIELQKDTAIAANSTIYIDLKQVLPTTQTIKGLSVCRNSRLSHLRSGDSVMGINKVPAGQNISESPDVVIASLAEGETLAWNATDFKME
jgi:hypothetical protein